MAMMMVLLQNCGMQLRSDDPAAMKVCPLPLVQVLLVDRGGAFLTGFSVTSCMSRLLLPCGACLSPLGCAWRAEASISTIHLV